MVYFTGEPMEMDEFLDEYAAFHTCAVGFTADEVAAIVSGVETAFQQRKPRTVAICDGLAYDPSMRALVDTNCGPHGEVVPREHMREFLEGVTNAAS